MGPSSPTSLQKVTIDSNCFKTFPCKHSCIFKFSDGIYRSLTLNQPQIGGLIKHLPNDQVDTQNEGHDHFTTGSISSINEIQNLINQVYEETTESELDNTSCKKCIIS